jgi:peptidyl-tRNA hydrolase
MRRWPASGWDPVRVSNRVHASPATPASDRDRVPQFVLPLVVHVERPAPPQRTDALEAAAQAVLRLLSDPRATDGEWAQPVHAWEEGRIRKVVRRARGTGWQRAAALPGITVTRGTAQVRVYPPIPVGGWPADLARLQVRGTDLADSGTRSLPEPDPATPVLWVNPGLEMTAGKAMAQVGHGAQLAWWRLPAAARAGWLSSGFELAVRIAAAQRWAELVESGLPLVRDGGFTEVAPGSCTVVADHPALH